MSQAGDKDEEEEDGERYKRSERLKSKQESRSDDDESTLKRITRHRVDILKVRI